MQRPDAKNPPERPLEHDAFRFAPSKRPFWPQNSQDSRATQGYWGRRSPAAGNGIFGCRDRWLKSAGETAKSHGRPKERNDTGENPHRNGLFWLGLEICGLVGLDGGRDRDRTCDPLDVNEVL